MSKLRDTYKYRVKVGREVVDGGFTNDRERRESERRRQYPGSHLVQVGRCTTREAAWDWEKQNGFT
jgi:hypothetical protein